PETADRRATLATRLSSEPLPRTRSATADPIHPPGISTRTSTNARVSTTAIPARDRAIPASVRWTPPTTVAKRASRAIARPSRPPARSTAEHQQAGSRYAPPRGVETLNRCDAAGAVLLLCAQDLVIP